MSDYSELIASLREDAEWAEANVWEVPIMLLDHLNRAADILEMLTEEKNEHGTCQTAEGRTAKVYMAGSGV